jgi:hypothetical protein
LPKSSTDPAHRLANEAFIIPEQGAINAFLRNPPYVLDIISIERCA